MSDFIQHIRSRFKRANIVTQFIYINIAVFALVFVFNTFAFLFKSDQNFIIQWFTLPADFQELLTKPWSIITYGFVHARFLHILFNLIALFFIGNLFTEYFTPKQFINFYVLGTLFGGIIFLLSYNYFPALTKDADGSLLLGASAGVSAILVGIATYLPNYQLKIPLIGYIKLWHIAVFWIVLDIIQIPMGNAGGHLAHLGGSLLGFLYVRQASNLKTNLFTPFKSVFKKKRAPLHTVHKSKNARRKTKPMGAPKSEHQQKIDAILDKISKSGYDTLTKEEKAFLFQQGKK